MSYDLFLAPRGGELAGARFAAYFRNRPHYTFEGSQAGYENPDTGVYFVFEYNARDPDAPAGEPWYPVSLNVNYFRPSFFIREAESEVTAFVRAFDCIVSDPQMHGMGEGEYDAQKLIEGWDHGNAFGYQAILGRNPDHPVHSLPATDLMRIWAWNRDRAALQERLGESCFVSKVVAVVTGGRLITIATWPDGYPIAVPPSDHLLVMREDLAPSRWFRKDLRPVIIPHAAAAALFAKHRDARHADVHVLGYGRTPDDVARFVRDLVATDDTLAGVAPDQVLDRELVLKYRPG